MESATDVYLAPMTQILFKSILANYAVLDHLQGLNRLLVSAAPTEQQLLVLSLISHAQWRLVLQRIANITFRSAPLHQRSDNSDCCTYLAFHRHQSVEVYPHSNVVCHLANLHCSACCHGAQYLQRLLLATFSKKQQISSPQ